MLLKDDGDSVVTEYKDGWIPVSEKVPETKTCPPHDKLLVTQDYGSFGGKVVKSAFYFMDWFRSLEPGDGYKCLCDITHWKPWPNPAE